MLLKEYKFAIKFSNIKEMCLKPYFKARMSGNKNILNRFSEVNVN